MPCCDQHQGHAKDPGLYTNSTKGDTFGETFINIGFFLVELNLLVDVGLEIVYPHSFHTNFEISMS